MALSMNALHKYLAKAPSFEEIDNSQDARLGLIYKAVRYCHAFLISRDALFCHSFIIFSRLV